MCCAQVRQPEVAGYCHLERLGNIKVECLEFKE